MLPREVLKQVRRLQLRARKAVENLLGGEYHSIFKGAGIAFEEVRPYQVGDDVRSIDWNVTARMDHPFIKRYIEERERTVILAVDTSASMRFGTGRLSKREVAAELAAVLAFSAVSNNDRVGLMLFSDKIEHYLPAKKGPKHVLRVVRDVLFFEPKSRGTSLTDGLDHLNRVVRRRSIVFLFSDFQGPEHERALGRTARRHELIAVWLADPRERQLPDVGLAELEDAESGRRLLVDTGSPELRAAYERQGREREEAVRRLLRGAGVDAIEATTDGRHLDALVRFFRLRQKQAMKER
jgi:uncharacterized protein (DUF58 family)